MQSQFAWKIKFFTLFIVLVASFVFAEGRELTSERELTEGQETVVDQIDTWLKSFEDSDPNYKEKRKVLTKHFESIEANYDPSQWLVSVQIIWRALSDFDPLVNKRGNNSKLNVLPSKACDSREYRIAEVLQRGGMVVLDDDSKYLIEESETDKTSSWNYFDKIMICKTKIAVSGNYYERINLVNSDGEINENVAATPLE